MAEEGFTVERASNGEDALPAAGEPSLAAAVLDLGLPDLPGVQVLKRWRAAGCRLPVLILTARDTWKEKVDGLNAGADDYITKPFHLPEVAARLRAVIRRSAGISNPLLTHRGISLDTVSNRVLAQGQPVEMTARELRLLNYFLHRVGRTISQTELAEQLYTFEEYRESNTVEVYISRLRRKLGSRCITTLRGLGYRMD